MPDFLSELVGLIALLYPLSGAAADCPKPGPNVRDIIADRFYTDEASSRVDKTIVAKNKASLAALDTNLRPIIDFSDKAMAGDSPAALVRYNDLDRSAGAPPGPLTYPWLGGDLTLMAKTWVKT
jgi:hypothetical protein